MNNEYDDEKERIVIKKVKRIEKINTILLIVLTILMPLLMVSLFIAKYYKLEIEGLLAILVLIVILIIPISMFFRRCPNCGHYFEKYTITFPKYCPKSGIKLK